MEYKIENERDLTAKERELITYILRKDNNTNYINTLLKARVGWRCGCGKCPTIILKYDQDINENNKEIATYLGKNSTTQLIGISIMANDTHIIEVEFWSPLGENVIDLPEIQTLQKITHRK